MASSGVECLAHFQNFDTTCRPVCKPVLWRPHSYQKVGLMICLSLSCSLPILVLTIANKGHYNVMMIQGFDGAQCHTYIISLTLACQSITDPSPHS